jgi:hypothetical protein
MKIDQFKKNCVLVGIMLLLLNFSSDVLLSTFAVQKEANVKDLAEAQTETEKEFPEELVCLAFAIDFQIMDDLPSSSHSSFYLASKLPSAALELTTPPPDLA